MARKAAVDPTSNLTLADLHRLINVRQRELDALMEKRQKLQSRIDEIDEQIAAMSPADVGMRYRNELSLADTLEKVLRENARPMGVRDIVQAVLKSGYKTTSSSFRGMVNQTLIKDDRFIATTRGIYSLKK